MVFVSGLNTYCLHGFACPDYRPPTTDYFIYSPIHTNYPLKNSI